MDQSKKRKKKTTTKPNRKYKKTSQIPKKSSISREIFPERKIVLQLPQSPDLYLPDPLASHIEINT